MVSKFFHLKNSQFNSTINFKDLSSLYNFLSIRTFVSFLGRLSLIIAVGLCVYIGELFKDAENEVLPVFELLPENTSNDQKLNPAYESYRFLANTHIFGKAKAASNPMTNNNQAPIALKKLRLVAINSISNGRKLAIIEDSNKQNQEVFEINETVFNQGKLTEIGSDSVKIEINGKIETLALQDISSKPGNTESPAEVSDNQTDFSIPEEELSQALNNLPQLLSQARAVPYFRNGQSIGMRLFAIRSGSLYEKLGLKNGDILLAVNDSSLSDPAEALKLFEQLKNQRSIAVKLERNSQSLSMQYTIR